MRFVVKDARHAFGRHRSQSGDINACRALSSLSHASARDEIVLRCQLCGAAFALEGGGPASQLPAKARFWTGAGDDYSWRRAQSRSSDTAENVPREIRSEEHTSELQSLMRNSYSVLCLKK